MKNDSHPLRARLLARRRVPVEEKRARIDNGLELAWRKNHALDRLEAVLEGDTICIQGLGVCGHDLRKEGEESEEQHCDRDLNEWL